MTAYSNSSTSDIVITGALIADGTGAPLFPADVLIRRDRIESIEPPGTVGGTHRQIMRADGKVLAPGFVDVHSHSDNAPLFAAGDLPKVRQGVTTEVVGNCGFSLAPWDGSAEMTAFLGQCFPPMAMPWNSFAQFLAAADAGGYITNMVPLLGEGTLRVLTKGLSNTPVNEDQRVAMIQIVQEACDAGAFGLSTGLTYLPGMFSTAAELTALVGAMPAGRIYATHMRREGALIREGLAEAVEVAEVSGHPLQISHLKVVDKRRWGTADGLLEIIDAAAARGVRLHQDVYPYTASSMMLSAALPPWVVADGPTAMMERLADPVLRRQMETELLDPDRNTDNHGWDSYVATAGYDGIRVASTASGRHDGRTLVELSADLSISPFEALARVITDEGNVANMIASIIDEGDLETILRHPGTMIGTDGAPPGFGNSPHPRVSGTFVRLLGKYSREKGVFSLAEAVARMTSLPADAFGLHKRGRIVRGNIADLVLLDPVTVADTATYDAPLRAPVGIDKVYIGGRLVVDNNEWTGIRSGQRLVPR